MIILEQDKGHVSLIKEMYYIQVIALSRKFYFLLLFVFLYSYSVYFVFNFLFCIIIFSYFYLFCFLVRIYFFINDLVKHSKQCNLNR